ncbi:LysR substrate-binding domain-containing protein [uncultured Pseudacidovorax sp.]|uniref:LysR substrate-binding domain-containing protein n=1 Tax=uncultured Pseudacidovorax sp. TaxID=679313 RepID=UPI0025F5354D|nr:LysR substrate-binding domain-containing protein [uncultured Pseudacidovorax sp.]
MPAPGRRALPPLLAVRAFEAAARRLSFSLAAQELNVTQSAISRQVRLLEDFLGHPLFLRLTRSVALTPEGAALFRAAEQSLDILEAATRRCRGDDGRTTLKLSITQSLAVNYLLPRLPAFAALRPDIEVRVLTSTAPVDFDRDDVDAAIRLGPLPGRRYDPKRPYIPHELARSWRGIAAFPLWDEVLTPVLARSLLEGQPPLQSPADLGRFTLLSVAPRPTAWSDWFRSQGARLPRGTTTSDFGHFFMTLDAARAGRGVALVPTLFLEGLRADASLAFPFPSSTPSAGEYYLLCREDMAKRDPVAAFLGWVQDDAQRRD